MTEKPVEVDHLTVDFYDQKFIYFDSMLEKIFCRVNRLESKKRKTGQSKC
jgi:hypothetical protein